MQSKHLYPAVFIVMFASAGMTACDRSDDPSGPIRSASGSPNKTVVVHGSKIRRPDEDAFVVLAQDEPGTAGFYIDATGNLVIVTTDTARTGAARTAFARHLAETGLGLPSAVRRANIVVKYGDYSFQQLSDWRDLVVDSLLGSHGVIEDDLDEGRNRVSIGLDRSVAGAEGEATTVLQSLGIPLKAIRFYLTSRTIPSVRSVTGNRTMLSATSLGSVTDTLGGGIQIGQGAFSCSTGLVVDQGSTRGLITGSHCTQTMYHLDGETWYQPYLNASGHHTIGTEMTDPAPVTCSIFQACDDKRNSDAAFVSVNYPSRRGAIARTQGTAQSGQAGTLNISSNPWINITGVETNLTLGLRLDKIGARTGWTYGTVSQTCLDIDVIEQSKTHRVFCNGVASIYTGLGDSGGPVFYWDGADGAIFFGLVDGLGDGCTDLCTVIKFTPVTQVTQDVGSFNAITPITVGVPSVSGNVSGSAPAISWGAVSTTNTTAATSYKIHRATWDADRGSYIDNDWLTSTTSTSFTDGTSYIPVNSYGGTTNPGSCANSWVAYFVRAYNAGVYQDSQTVYFIGAASTSGCTGG